MFVIIMVEIKRATLTAQITLTGTMSTVHIIIIPDMVRERGSSMIYYTGDIHGSADAFVRFCINKNLQQKDVVILLGEEDYVPMADHYNSLTEFTVWERWYPGDRVPEGYTLIFGHTPTYQFRRIKPLEVWYGENAIGIDCGCGFPVGRLACLRLDDGMEFYSEEMVHHGEGKEDGS